MWKIIFDEAFARELDLLERPVQVAIATYAEVLRAEGPNLGRPWADTLNGSRHANMEELRPTVNRVEWRVAFAFDPARRAILLAGAAKGGKKDAVVYRRLIRTADDRFDAHLRRIAAKTKET